MKMMLGIIIALLFLLNMYRNLNTMETNGVLKFIIGTLIILIAAYAIKAF